MQQLQVNRQGAVKIKSTRIQKDDSFLQRNDMSGATHFTKINEVTDSSPFQRPPLLPGLQTILKTFLYLWGGKKSTDVGATEMFLAKE